MWSMELNTCSQRLVGVRSIPFLIAGSAPSALLLTASTSSRDSKTTQSPMLGTFAKMPPSGNISARAAAALTVVSLSTNDLEGHERVSTLRVFTVPYEAAVRVRKESCSRARVECGFAWLSAVQHSWLTLHCACFERKNRLYGVDGSVIALHACQPLTSSAWKIQVHDKRTSRTVSTSRSELDFSKFSWYV